MDSGGSFLFSGFPLVGGGVRCTITNGMQMGVGLWPALAKRQRSEPGHTQPHTHARLRTSAQKGPAPHSPFERLCVVPIGTAKVRAPAASPQMRHQRSLSRNERASLRGRGACLRTGGGGEQNQRTKCVVTKQRVCMGNALPVLARAKRAHWCVNEGRGTGGEGGGGQGPGGGGTPAGRRVLEPRQSLDMARAHGSMARQTQRVRRAAVNDGTRRRRHAISLADTTGQRSQRLAERARVRVHAVRRRSSRLWIWSVLVTLLGMATPAMSQCLATLTTRTTLSAKAPKSTSSPALLRARKSVKERMRRLIAKRSLLLERFRKRDLPTESWLAARGEKF